MAIAVDYSLTVTFPSLQTVEGWGQGRVEGGVGGGGGLGSSYH